MVFKQADGCLCAAPLLLFLDKKMLVCEGGDLRKMRDAQDLLCARKRLEFLTNSLGSSSANTNVNFVEYQRARHLCFLLLRLICAFFHADFQRQQHARHLSAGSDLVQWLQRFASFSSFFAASPRRFVNNCAALRYSSSAAFNSTRRDFTISSRFSTSFSLAATSSPYAITPARVGPYLRLSRSSAASRSSISARRSGEA